MSNIDKSPVSINDFLRIHQKEGWMGQMKRIDRWMNKLKSVSYENITTANQLEEYLDLVYTCFQNIFYMKDWLTEDGIFNRSELNQFINQNKEIGICRDICNGTKHFDINNPSVDKDFGLYRRFNPMASYNNEPMFSLGILTKENSFDAFNLANKCIDLWKNLINDKLNEKASH